MYQIQKLNPSPEWPAAIGRALMAFGEIERWTTALIRSCLGWDMAKKSVQLPLVVRLKYLDTLLRQDGVPPDDLARWSEAYEVVQDLRTRYRNRLAHGTPGDIVVVTDEAITQTIEHATPRRPADGLTLEEVKEVGERTERASARMAEASGKIVKWIYDENRVPLTPPPLPKGPMCSKCGTELPGDDDLPR